MTFVPYSRVLPRSLWRPAIFFFAVAQIFLAFAPLLEGRHGRDAGPHVEAAGVSAHYAHDETDCSACIARGLLASAEPQQAHMFAISIARSNLDVTSSAFVLTSSLRDLRSRAPPILIA